MKDSIVPRPGRMTILIETNFFDGNQLKHVCWIHKTLVIWSMLDTTSIWVSAMNYRLTDTSLVINQNRLKKILDFHYSSTNKKETSLINCCRPLTFVCFFHMKVIIKFINMPTEDKTDANYNSIRIFPTAHLRVPQILSLSFIGLLLDYFHKIHTMIQFQMA